MTEEEREKAFDALQALGHDWDSYGSEPPSEDTIELARKIVEDLYPIVTAITPVSGGSVGIKLYPDSEIEIICHAPE